MSENITIARPYAKAIFEHALAAKQLQKWSTYLFNLAHLVLEPSVADFIHNPASTTKQHRELLLSILNPIADTTNSESMYLTNLVHTLADNKRLMILPGIVTLFEAMRADQEKTLTVNVVTYSPLSSVQQERLIESLSKRLARQVTLNLSIDKTLIGGAVIQAHNLVIDGSVRHKLNKLRTSLAV